MAADKLPAFVEPLRFSVRRLVTLSDATHVALFRCQAAIGSTKLRVSVLALKCMQLQQLRARTATVCWAILPVANAVRRIVRFTHAYPSSEGHVLIVQATSNAKRCVQNLAEGARVWGAVQEVTVKRLVISLPHGLRGFVAPADASDVLRSLAAEQPSKADLRLRALLHGAAPLLVDLFYPGQFVRCMIKSLEADAAAEGAGKAAKKGKQVRPSHLWLPRWWRRL